MDSFAYMPGRCPPNRPLQYKNPPLCGMEAGSGKYNQSTMPAAGNDLAQIRALGFNLVRLGISWSLLEPQPGSFSEEYLRRIEQVVKWAAEQDIWVLIDFHQDFYSYSLDNGSKIGSYVDGAPPWAVLNASISSFPLWEQWLFGKVGFDWQTVAAFRAFYNNERPVGSPMGIQEHYIRAVASVVARFRENRSVLGFELMNEPAPSELDVFAFSDKLLYPFYKRIVQAVTGINDGMVQCPMQAAVGDSCAFPDLGIHDTRHLIFFEPMALRNQLDFSVQTSRPWTNYTNIVFSPHTYTYSFTLDIDGFTPITGYAESLDSAWREATAMRSSVLVTEFGSAPDHLERSGNISLQQDLHLTSSTFWVWKEGHGGWGLWIGASGEAGFRLNGDRVRQLSRARPLAVAGRLLSLRYVPALAGRNSSLNLSVETNNVTTPTLVYVPAHLHTPNISVFGAAWLVRVTLAPDGSHTVTVASEPSVGQLYFIAISAGERSFLHQ